MSGLFAGTPLERPVTCTVCERPLEKCQCPRDAGGRVLLPADQTAVVRLERRRNGKVVTLVSGLDPAASDLAAIVQRIKSACGAGGTVRGDGIEVQGDHRKKTIDTLTTLGYRVKP